MSSDEPFTVVVDSREQNPLDFGSWPTITKALPTGDYSVAGIETLIAIERKSLSDLVGSFTGGRDRFEREMLRMKSYRCRASFGRMQYRRYLCGALEVESLSECCHRFDGWVADEIRNPVLPRR